MTKLEKALSRKLRSLCRKFRIHTDSLRYVWIRSNSSVLSIGNDILNPPLSNREKKRLRSCYQHIIKQLYITLNATGCKGYTFDLEVLHHCMG